MIAELQTEKLNGDSVRSVPIDALPTSASGWPPRPFQIVSLFEMLGFWALPFYQMTYQLHAYIEGELYGNIERRGAQTYLNDKDKERARQVLDNIKFLCEPFEMEQTIRRYYSAHQVTYYHTTSLEKLRWEIQEIEGAIRSDLTRITLMFFPKDKTTYLALCRTSPDGLFGPIVTEKFPEADKEIAMAGNCYAMEAYTACVFHLGRAVEIAARVMVSALKVEKELKNMKGQVIPAKLATWEQLLAALQKGVDAKQANIGGNVRRKETYEFYHHAMSQFRNFQHAWRNKVSHKRKTYQAGETKDILDNVKQFMVHISQRLKEPKGATFD